MPPGGGREYTYVQMLMIYGVGDDIIKPCYDVLNKVPFHQAGYSHEAHLEWSRALESDTMYTGYKESPIQCPLLCLELFVYL